MSDNFIKVKIESAADVAGFDQGEAGIKKIEDATKRLTAAEKERADMAAKWDASPFNPKNAATSAAPAEGKSAADAIHAARAGQIVTDIFTRIVTAVDEAVREQQRLTAEMIKETAEFEKQAELMERKAAAAKNEHDVIALTVQLQDHLRGLREKADAEPLDPGSYVDKVKDNFTTAKNWLKKQTGIWNDDPDEERTFEVKAREAKEHADRMIETERVQGERRNKQAKEQADYMQQIETMPLDERLGTQLQWLGRLRDEQGKMDVGTKNWQLWEAKIEMVTQALEKTDAALEKVSDKERRQQDANARGAARAEKDFAADMAKIDREVDAEEKKEAAVAKALRDEHEQHEIQIALLAGHKEIAAELTRQKTLHDEIDRLVKDGVPEAEAAKQAGITAELEKQLALKKEMSAHEAVADADAVAAAGTHRSKRGLRLAKEKQYEDTQRRELADKGFDGADLESTLAGEMETYRRQNRGHRIGGPTARSSRDHLGDVADIGHGLTADADWRNLFRHGIGPHVAGPRQDGSTLDSPAAPDGVKSPGAALNGASGAVKKGGEDVTKAANDLKKEAGGLSSSAAKSIGEATSAVKEAKSAIIEKLDALTAGLKELKSQVEASRTA